MATCEAAREGSTCGTCSVGGWLKRGGCARMRLLACLGKPLGRLPSLNVHEQWKCKCEYLGISVQHLRTLPRVPNYPRVMRRKEKEEKKKKIDT